MVVKKKTNKSVYFMAVFVALIMILSIFGIMLGNSDNELTYNKFKFKIVNSDLGNLFSTKVAKKELIFYNLPYMVENINMSPSIKNTINNAQFIAIGFDPSKDFNNSYVTLVRYDLINIFTEKGFEVTIQNSSIFSYPILSCENATSLIPVILISSSNETSIVENSQNKFCIVLNGDRRELLMVQDRFIYGIFGIIK